MQSEPISPSNQSQTSDLQVQNTPLKKSRKQMVWTISQNKIYLEFLKQNKPLFKSEFTRRSSKVFEKLSTKLQHRNADQCRTHHQKMFRRHKSIYKVIRYVDNLIRKFSQQNQSHIQSQREEVFKINQAGWMCMSYFEKILGYRELEAGKNPQTQRKNILLKESKQKNTILGQTCLRFG